MRQQTGTADAYLYARAEAELCLARTATHPAAVRAHYLLAGYYLDRYFSAAGEAVPRAKAVGR